MSLEQFWLSDRVTLSKLACRRVFLHVPQQFGSSARTGRISFGQYVWFSAAEMDRMASSSVEFWFRVMDCDDDGFVSSSDLRMLLAAKSAEMRKEVSTPKAKASTTAYKPGLSDALCQLIDLVRPAVPDRISALDIKRANVGGIVYDIVLNKDGSAASKNYLV